MVIDKVIFSDCYWFIKCILIYYAITFFILKYPHITMKGKRWSTLNFCFYVSCLIAVVAAFSQQPNGLSLFQQGCASSRCTAYLLFSRTFFQFLALQHCLTFSDRLLHHGAYAEWEAEQCDEAFCILVVVEVTCRE